MGENAMALLKQGNFINVGAASFQERKLLPFSHMHCIPKADSPFLALRSFASPPKMITHVNRSSNHQDSESNVFEIEAIICSERVEAVSLALSEMGIQVTITDVWGGFGIQIMPDHPNDVNTVLVNNKKIDMMVDANKVKSVVDAIIKASNIECPVGDYKSFYVIPTSAGLCNDSAYVYKLEIIVYPFSVEDTAKILAVSSLGRNGAYFNSNDLYSNVSKPIIVGCCVASSKVGHIIDLFKLLGSEDDITVTPVSDALVIRREFDRGPVEVSFAPKGRFDLWYTEQSRDFPSTFHRRIL